jgi:hypothetical protein
MTIFSAIALVTLAACGPNVAEAQRGNSGTADAEGVTREIVSQPRSAQPASPPISQPPPIDPAIALLDRLEIAAEGLHDFSADITYYLWDSMLQRREIRGGEILYDVRPNDGSRRFAILVTSVSVGNRRDNQNKRYIFDGSWFVEIDYDNRMFTKRQIVAPGERFDPLKLGEGPFPLPVGQRRDDVLARFEASLLDGIQDKVLAKFLAGKAVEGLKLVPRPSTPQADEIADIEIFYDTATLLPLGIVLTEISGNRKTVLLRNLKRNQGIDESKLGIEQPDPKQWQIDVRPWVAQRAPNDG